MRLVAAEWLKLRRRTGLVLSAFGITVVPALIMLGVEDDGGLRGFANHFGVLVLLTAWPPSSSARWSGPLTRRPACSATWS